MTASSFGKIRLVGAAFDRATETLHQVCAARGPTRQPATTISPPPSVPKVCPDARLAPRVA